MLFDNLQVIHDHGAILEETHYYPFGMVMPSRSYEAQSSYRYGFNGQEKSDEIFEGSTTALFWEYDSRTGRRWNVDPEGYLWESPYSCLGNNPIGNADPYGDIYIKKSGENSGQGNNPSPGGGGNGSKIESTPLPEGYYNHNLDFNMSGVGKKATQLGKMFRRASRHSK